MQISSLLTSHGPCHNLYGIIAFKNQT